MDKVYNFLDIKNCENRDEQFKSHNVSIWSMSRLKLLRLRNQFIYEYYQSNTRIRRRKGITSFLVNSFCRGIDEGLLKFVTSNKRPDLNVDLRAQLMQYYQADISKLRQWRLKNQSNNYGR